MTRVPLQVRVLMDLGVGGCSGTLKEISITCCLRKKCRSIISCQQKQFSASLTMWFPKYIMFSKLYFSSFPRASLFIEGSIFHSLMRTSNTGKKVLLGVCFPAKTFCTLHSQRISRSVFYLLQPEGPETGLGIATHLLLLSLLCP